jgi:hypothetical protein
MPGGAGGGVLVGSIGSVGVLVGGTGVGVSVGSSDVRVAGMGAPVAATFSETSEVGEGPQAASPKLRVTTIAKTVQGFPFVFISSSGSDL